MTTTFPDAIDSYSTKVDGVTDVMAADVNDLQDAVVAIETAIGVPPNYITDVYSPIINSGMDIWQRGTSFATAADGTYSADRWIYNKSGAMVHTLSQETSNLPTPANAKRKFNYALKFDLTTPDSAIAAGDYCIISQKIEGYNWNKLAQQIVTVSFWINAKSAGTFCVALRNSGLNRSCVQEVNISTGEAGTWVQKSATFPASPTAGTWNYTNGVGVIVSICFAGGTNYRTTAGSWQTGNFFATANQTNEVNTGETPHYITGVDITLGSVARTIVPLDFDVELARCERYYRNSYNLTVAPGTNTLNGAVQYQTRTAIAGSTAGTLRQGMTYTGRMRAAGAVTIYATDGTINAISNVTGGNVRTGVTAAGLGETGFLQMDVSDADADAIAADNILRFHWVADAEL